MKLLYTLPTTLILFATTGAITTISLAKSPQSQSSKTTLIANKSEDISQHSDKKPGGLFVPSKDGKTQVFPLKHTEVKANISGNVSRVEVTQTFENPFKDALEAVYVFPLPDQAAVDDMEIKIGDRIIKGNIKKREEAQKIYEEARREGKTAGLLEQERDNIFTQSLANIKPGEKIDVTIRYTESMKFEKGNYEFVFPMVVGPRYIPGNPIIKSAGDTDRVPDASRITPPVLKPGTRSGHDITVTVEIDAGIAIPKIWSTSHQIVSKRSGKIVTVKLRDEDNIPNKDLILRYQIAGENTQATVLTQSDQKGGHFATYLIPAVEYRSNQIVPKDVVFLMDTSGSQSGDPLVKSQELMRRFIKGLNPEDTFTIINFANTTEQLSATPLANTAENRAKAMAYIDKLNANGGTELLNGMRAVMNFPAAKAGRLRSVVLLTDGYIGNENEILSEVQRELKPGNRLYSFGVGSSVNRFLLERLGEVGRGTSQVIRQDESTEEVAEKFFRQINNPVLTNIQVTWEGAGEKPEIYPEAPPDLFANQPLVIFGRKKDRRSGNLRITGIMAGGKRFEKTLPVNLDTTGNPAIAQLWGRARIKDLMNLMFGGETKSGVEAVTNTALAYRLLSQYTAFVAVSDEVRVNPDGSRQRVQVPVELPQGVSYKGIFGDSVNQNSSPGPALYESMPISPNNSRFAMPRRNIGMYMPPSAPMSTMGTGSRGMPTAQEKPDGIAKKPKVSQNQLNAINSRIQILNADGLDAAAISSLNQHLQNITITQAVSGEIVLEFPVKNGRVGSIVLDEQDSTLSDKMVIDLIKRSLVTWQSPASLTGTIRLKLRIL